MYYIEKNNKIILFDEDKQKLVKTLEFMPEYKDLKIRQTDRPIEGFVFADTEEYQEQKEAEERERISRLSLTKREVFLAVYKAKNITPDQIKAQITDPEALIEFEYANEYFRGNPLIDVIGKTLGFTSEELDTLFVYGGFSKNEDLQEKEVNSDD